MFYVVNNSGLYVFRHTNGSFPSKWAGIWALDKKYVDYWAYKVNGVWLSPDLCAWSNGHNYKVGDITVRETVHVRQGKVISSLTFEGNGDVSLDLEVGVNMRYRDEDLHGRKYSFDKGKIVSDLGKLTVKLMGSSFKPLGLYSTHNPGSNIPFALWYEQEQSKFVPGIWHTEFKLKGKKKLNTYFIVDFKNKNVEEPFGEFRNRELSSLMKIAFSGLKTFAANNHLKGVIAGYPYFNEIWVRDTLIVLP
ncbi:MAG TPA: hypothetical protein ENG01_00085, partial [Candidatus Aenigmarchaeota archaeon]|nr:hypothetical protein [Candidatus Aenigmarchaeota archaeon]HEX32800.1 hypothetical protein [Candidatus Aenigmarchaeota archaeon]